jgi:hypothetical protein
MPSPGTVAMQEEEEDYRRWWVVPTLSRDQDERLSACLSSLNLKPEFHPEFIPLHQTVKALDAGAAYGLLLAPGWRTDDRCLVLAAAAYHYGKEIHELVPDEGPHGIRLRPVYGRLMLNLSTRQLKLEGGQRW